MTISETAVEAVQATHPDLPLIGRFIIMITTRVERSSVLKLYAAKVHESLEAWYERGKAGEWVDHVYPPHSVALRVHVVAPAPDTDLHVDIVVRLELDRSLNTLPWTKGSNQLTYSFEAFRPSLTTMSAREMRAIGKLYDNAGLVAETLAECITKAATTAKLTLSVK